MIAKLRLSDPLKLFELVGQMGGQMAAKRDEELAG